MTEWWRWGFESLAVTGVLFFLGMLAGLGLSFIACRETWQDVCRNQPGARLFAVTLLLALLLRLAWIAYAQPEPVSDYSEYWQLGQRIAAGDWTYSSIDKHPGIILLVAACFKCFGSPWSIWTMNLLLSALCMALTYRIGLLMAGPWVALAAAVLMAFQPQLIAYSALFASELPTLFFYLLLTWFAVRSRQTDASSLGWVALGVALYTAVLTRSTSLLFLGLVPVTCLIFRYGNLRQELKRSAAFVVTACLLLSTWLYHQHLLTGKWQLFWGGEIWLVSTTHYETQGRLVNPWSVPGLKEKIRERTKELTGPQNRMAALAVMKEWAIPIIQQDPVHYLSEGRTRLRHILWTTSETGIRDTQAGSTALLRWPEKAVTRLAEVSKQLWRVTLILALTGLALLAWRRQEKNARAGMLLIGMFLAIWTTFHYVMAVASDRWAVQIIPYAVLFAGYSLVECFALLGTFFKRMPNASVNTSQA